MPPLVDIAETLAWDAGWAGDFGALAAAVVISCGGSVGKEAAIAVLCAALGAAVSQRLGVTVRERRTYLTAGCAAGVGAIFQTPLGGALFATSVLYSEPEVEAEALMPSIIASVTSCRSMPANVDGSASPRSMSSRRSNRGRAGA